MSDSICFFTLGASPGIVAEALGCLDPEGYRLFEGPPAHRPLTTVREVRVVASDGASKAVRLLERWWASSAVASERSLEIIQVQNTNQLNLAEECRRMDEAILQLVLDARRDSRDSNRQLRCCLAGGRKTMSAMLQKASGLFGCDDLFHVLASPSIENWTNDRKRDEQVPFIPGHWEDGATLGAHLRDQIVVVPLGEEPGIEGLLEEIAADPRADPPSGEWTSAGGKRRRTILWQCAPAQPLRPRLDDLVHRAARTGRNYVASSLGPDFGSSFPSLLRLPSRTIEALRGYRIGVDRANEEQELRWIRALPKADLHCHLGGVLDPEGLLEVVAAVYAHEAAPGRRRRSILDSPALRQFTAKVAKSSQPPQRMVKDIDPDRSDLWAWTCAAVKAFDGRADELERRIYADYPDEASFRGLSRGRRNGLAQYMALGDLQGSSLLTHPVALERACTIAAQRAIADGVLYLELRCSPMNCTPKRRPRPADSRRVAETIAGAFEAAKSSRAADGSPWWWGLITMATRHKLEENIDAAVDEAVRFKKANVPGFIGFDVAGQEAMRSPKYLRPQLLPLLELCVPMTVHAGEVTSAREVWEAIYHLGAERIGHGLELNQMPALRDRIRERGVAIEMCPSSNDQIVGFENRRYPDKRFAGRTYPLASYLAAGLRVTINTDNPGHSRTTLSREYLRAAWMSPHGLTAWDVLRIAYNGFISAFLPAAEREALVREADRQVFELLEAGQFPWPAG